MVDPSAIADLEAAAANLDRLLRGWTEAVVAETQSTSSSISRPESLSTINAGIQSLWRLVSIHKSIEQLKNPPAPADQPPQRATPNPSPSPKPIKPPTAPPTAPQTPYVPHVPSVPSVPSLGSLDEIIAKTDQVYAEVTALCQASGIPVPDPAPDPAAAADQLGLNLLDALSRRAKYPGSGRLLDSIRSDLATSPP